MITEREGNYDCIKRHWNPVTLVIEAGFAAGNHSFDIDHGYV